MAKILLVEDDLDLAMIVTDSLSAQEHQVEHAATGPAARDRLSSSAYDLVILDWDLPGCSGYDVLREYRGRGGDTAVVMLSGRNSFDEKEAALDAGADDYLTKPFALKELRARVRSILRRTSDSKNVQTVPAPTNGLSGVPPFPQPSVPAQGPPEAIGPGTLLDGKYYLEEQLGQSETAIVWKAMHKVMNRPVVVKMLASHLVDNAAASTGFMAECRAMARLSHPNVINVFDTGTLGKAPFVVMEYFRGETIRQIIEKFGAAPVRTALGVTTQICRGLQAAHNCGIIHRDLKPANIIIQNQTDRNNTLVKIVDFGISFLEGSTERITQDGTVAGTIGYIAPEQLQDMPIDTRADIYAVGVILYEMLSGLLPFEAKTAHAMLIKKATESPIPIFTRRPEIPAGSPIDLILKKCLQRNPNMRYQTADQLRTDLERVLAQRF